jgi:diguanylate cyclase (GGDEF)-like protein
MIETIERFLKVNPELPFSVAIADIDFFKKVNDTYGHNCGDYTLVKLTELFKAHAAGKYSVCRWGGEEFLILGRHCGDLSVLLDDLRTRIMEHIFECEADEGMAYSGLVRKQVTVTIGAANYRCGMSVREWIGVADSRLYNGKQTGKNKVVLS